MRIASLLALLVTCGLLGCAAESSSKKCPPCGVGLQCNPNTGQCVAPGTLDSGGHPTVDRGTTPGDLSVDSRVDLGGQDPCLLDFYSNGTDTLGCNGPKPGPQPANAYGGMCTGQGAGTCTGANAFCFGTTTGICTIPCAIANENYYISTSSCPTGSRCFNLGGQGYCFPDCVQPSDCSTQTCDEDGSCTSPD